MSLIPVDRVRFWRDRLAQTFHHRFLRGRRNRSGTAWKSVPDGGILPRAERVVVEIATGVEEPLEVRPRPVLPESFVEEVVLVRLRVGVVPELLKTNA